MPITNHGETEMSEKIKSSDFGIIAYCMITALIDHLGVCGVISENEKIEICVRAAASADDHVVNGDRDFQAAHNFLIDMVDILQQPKDPRHKD